METIAEAAEALHGYISETERARVLGTVPPDVEEVREVAKELEILGEMHGEPECACFDGLRWTALASSQRREVLVWLLRMSKVDLDAIPRGLDIESAVEALQRVCETEGVI